VSPPWCAETRLQGRYRKRAGDCRRWAGGRYCNRGRRGSVGSVPSHCAVALRIHFREPRGLTPAPLLVVGRMSLNGGRFFQHAVRVAQPRGAYAPRSWLYMRLCIAKVAISPAHVRACKQERRA
jgi:hypothetical protein